MKYLVSVLVLFMGSIDHAMVPHHIIQQCRPIVRSVCYSKKLNTNRIKSIMQLHPDDTIKYLTDVSKGYEHFSDNIDDFNAISDPIKTELQRSVVRQKRFLYASGGFAGVLLPGIGATTLGLAGISALSTIAFPILLISNLGTKETIINLINVFVSVPCLWGATSIMGLSTYALGMLVQDNIVDHKKTLQYSINKNNTILNHYIKTMSVKNT